MPAPLKGQFLERLYNRAVTVQRSRLNDFEAHIQEALRREHPRRIKKLAPMVERQLYSFPMALKSKHLSEARTAQESMTHSLANRREKLALDEQEAMAKRLCDESLAHKQASLVAMDAKARELPPELPLTTLRKPRQHCPKTGSNENASTSPALGKLDAMEQQVYKLVLSRRHRKLTRSEVAQMGQRLCNESLRHKGEELEELESRYSFNQRRAPSRVLTADQLKSSAERLWKGEK